MINTGPFLDKISILIPSREGADKLDKTISNLLAKAAFPGPESLEILVCTQRDDSSWPDYETFVVEHPHVQLLTVLALGYYGIGEYLNRCYLASTGSILWALCDDVEVVTNHWDVALRAALTGKLYHAACMRVNEGPYNTCNYPWAFPALHRSLSDCIGHFAPGDVAYDRVINAYANVSGRGVKAAIDLKTVWTIPTPGTDRANWYYYNRTHWHELLTMWRMEARLWNERVPK